MDDGARTERLHDWFALQLEFADAVANEAAMPLAVALESYTNLHRRFGFGRVEQDGRAAAWDGFVRDIIALPDLQARLACTLAFARGRLVGWSGTSGRGFGCFSFDAPKDRVVRLHFSPNDKEDGVGPLSRRKYARRVTELAEMFAFIRREHPDVRYVKGGSWLYNIEAYRRLFPPPYIDSLKVHTSSSSMTGGSWWGQFLDHDENVIDNRARPFVANLRNLDPTALWRVFPLPPKTAIAPIEWFHEHYMNTLPTIPETT